MMTIGLVKMITWKMMNMNSERSNLGQRKIKGYYLKEMRENKLTKEEKEEKVKEVVEQVQPVVVRWGLCRDRAKIHQNANEI